MADYEFTKFIPEKWAGHVVRTSKNGTELLRIQFRRAHPQMQVNADFTPEITFEEFGGQQFKPVIPSLMHLHDTVLKTIELFNGEF
jgi:hypothetical protein